MCNILPRIKEIADREGITIGTLERVIGASKGVLSRAINKGTDIQAKWLELIVEKYPQYSAQWLLTGTGTMLLPQDGDLQAIYNPAERVPEDTPTFETRPRVPFDAAAGALSFGPGSVMEEDCEQLPVVPTFPRYDFTIVAKGESMHPEIHSGDELACAMLKANSFIQWGRIYILDTADGIIVKRIFDNSTSILCRSINPDFPDFEVPKSDIYHLALVVGLIRHL